MGDAPHPNNPSFPMTRYTSTAASAAAGELPDHNHHHQLLQHQNSIPYFYSYSPYTFASHLQTDYFTGPGLPVLPFSDSNFRSDNDHEHDMDAVSDDYEDPDFLLDDQVSFCTDLLDRPAEDSNLSLGLALGLGHIDEDMDDSNGPDCAGLGVGVEMSDFTPDVDLELGLGLGMGSYDAGKLGRGDFSDFASISGHGPSFLGGLRVVDVDSESDSDQNQPFDSQIHSTHVEIDGIGDDLDHPSFCWDCHGFNQQQLNRTNDFEFQEQEAEEDGEEEAIAVAQNDMYDWYYTRRQNDEDREIEADDQLNLHSDSDEDREIDDSLEGAFQGLDWDILLAVNNLNRELDDDETMFGVVEESMNDWRGNPPAAKSVVETLKVVHLSHEEIKENEITCAICWGEISAKEPLRQLPCRHYYHGDCIMTWLDIRNTCPVCRHELPTDDLEYEWQKREMDGQEYDGGGFLEDLPVSYENLHVFL